MKPNNNLVLFQLSSNFYIYFVGVHVLLMLFVFIYLYWCPTRFPYQMMFVSLNSNTTVSLVEQELLTLP